MLNVYEKFDRPESLDGYGNEYHINWIIKKLKGANLSLTKVDKDILEKNKDKLKTDPGLAYRYARVMKERFGEAEPYIKKDPEIAMDYAVHVIKGRFEKAEPYIMKEPGIAFWYANDVIGHRWLEAEPYIQEDDSWWGAYKKTFGVD